MSISKLAIAMVISIALFLSISSPLATADEKLIQQECHYARVPDVCAQCCDSDPRSKDADAVGIATIVLGCTSSHAVKLAANLSEIARKATNQTMKEAYLECSEYFSTANTNLSTAVDMVRKGEYNAAELVLGDLGEEYFEICSWMVSGPGRASEGETDFVSPGVSYQMNVFDSLGEAASRIIERL
ncbi:hypothetical protein Nepgr_013407 [Nepenthes gracilis]|uniref:Pectinesterase inhibitor domain-containing protein n=1 Tax=Nepenthes gracilis TaxID=150966 RepID=A0AAD3XPA5_NEPGR|nr:hypothetical protein Nepgr_013407 [Nepenthes gracilis]